MSIGTVMAWSIQYSIDVFKIAYCHSQHGHYVFYLLFNVAAFAVLQPYSVTIQQGGELFEPFALWFAIADFPVVPVLTADAHCAGTVSLPEASLAPAFSNTSGELRLANDLESHCIAPKLPGAVRAAPGY